MRIVVFPSSSSLWEEEREERSGEKEEFQEREREKSYWKKCIHLTCGSFL